MIIRIDENTVKVVNETIIDLQELRDRIQDLTNQANSIPLLPVPRIKGDRKTSSGIPVHPDHRARAGTLARRDDDAAF
jgi:hypothetical protein